MNFFVHEGLPRHYSGKDRDPNNQFHLSGKCMYVQAGQADKVERQHCRNTFTASIIQMKCTDVYTVTSKQLYRLLHYTVQSAVRPTNDLSTRAYQSPLHVLALTTHTVFSCYSSTGWLPTATTVQWRTKWPPEQCSSEMPSCCQWSR